MMTDSTDTTRPVVILGPTAGGKSELAVLLAQRLGPGSRTGQIISADSMQIYRLMDAGTAKPTKQMRQQVPHHLIDIVEPAQRFTVAHWLEKADALIEQLSGQGIAAIVVGGTNLYIKALLVGLFDGPPQDAAYRARLAELTGAQLHEQLELVDPQSAQRIHPNDRKKLIRALEVYHLTATPISSWQTQWQQSEASQADRQPLPDGAEHRAPYRHDPILLGLEWSTDRINQRINARVKAMFFPTQCGLGSESLPDEVQRLDSAAALGDPDSQARQALGYKQVLEHLSGQCTLDEAFEKTKILTRRFAKAQRTWFKRFTSVKWLDADHHSTEQLADSAFGYIKQTHQDRSPSA